MENYCQITWIFLLLCFSINAPAQEYDWKYKRETQGLKIYTRKVADSNLKELKFTTTVDASLHSVIALLRDVNAYQNWVYKCTKSENKKMVGYFETYDYYELDFPWPIADRDLYTHSSMKQDPDTKVVIAQTKGIPDFAPVNKDFIRVEVQENKWTLTPISKYKVHISYFLKAEPAGTIPDWLVNMVVDHGPVRSMKRFRELLSLDKYKNAVVNGILNY